MTWKVDRIRERYISMEMDVECRNIISRKMLIKTINNPEAIDVWFFHIKNKNIEALQEMLDEGVIDINIKSQEHGDTIVHVSIQRRSLKLLDFCIKNKADFNIKSDGEGETAFFESSHGYVGLKVFRRVWRELNVKKFNKTLNDQSHTGQKLYERLCYDDRNVYKLEWLSKEYPIEWNKFNQINNEKMIKYSMVCEANKNLFFIKGLQNIKNKLQKNLLQTNKLSKKIKI